MAHAQIQTGFAPQAASRRDESVASAATIRRALLVAGAFGGVALNGVALLQHAGPWFAMFLAAELAVLGGRLTTRGGGASLAVAWSGLQGAAFCAAALSGVAMLQLLAAVLVMAQLGVVCAQHAAAPRRMVLLATLCDLPFLAGALLAGDMTGLVLLLQVPLWCYAAVALRGAASARFRLAAAEAM